jgi:hypothetical protein
MPVLPQHLGLKDQQSNGVEVKKLLAIKEQDLMYAKQRNEKLMQELETLRKDLN